MVVGLFLFVAAVFVVSMTYAVYRATNKQYKQAVAGFIVGLVPTYFILQGKFYDAFFDWLDKIPPGWGIL